MSPVFANKGFHPQLSITPTSEACNQDAMEISGEMTQILEQLQAELRLSQEAQAHTANLHQVPSLFYQTGDLVWLNTKNIRTHHPCKKLDDKWIGLFKVLKTIRSRACHLELPHTLKIHPVFHVSLCCSLYCTVLSEYRIRVRGGRWVGSHRRGVSRSAKGFGGTWWW